MITEQKLREEITRMQADMATAADSRREYMIGALSMAWWVIGDFDRGTAFRLACEAWDQARPTAPATR